MAAAMTAMTTETVTAMVTVTETATTTMPMPMPMPDNGALMTATRMTCQESALQQKTTPSPWSFVFKLQGTRDRRVPGFYRG